jgi:hypothetical protein
MQQAHPFESEDRGFAAKNRCLKIGHIVCVIAEPEWLQTERAVRGWKK